MHSLSSISLSSLHSTHFLSPQKSTKMASGNTLIQSLKIMLMSTGVLFIAILLSLSFPHLLSSLDLPTLWSTFRGWLRPPYLYVIINGIIITIAATSRLHHHHHHAPMTETSPHAPTTKAPAVVHHREASIAVRADQFSPYDAVSVGSYYGAVSVDSVGSYDYGGGVSVKDVDVVEEIAVRSVGIEERERRIVEEVFKAPGMVRERREIGGERKKEKSTVVERSTWNNLPPLARQRPAVELMSSSSRFGHHRRPAKATPAEGGKALRVAKPKKHDTLESTWKAITEGRHIPLTRHQKTKSETWENHSRQINLLDDEDDVLSSAPMKKSETFKDRTNYSPLASPPPPPTAAAFSASKLKKEPSLGQDELNRRVEAFIHKFNEDMRLQRQQSLQQFMEKINRAA